MAAIAPSSGTALGGTAVTITGTNFTGATGVNIGGAAATNLVVVNATTITAVTPAGTVGTASVLVTTQGGTNAANSLYTYVASLTTTQAVPSTTLTLNSATGTPVTPVTAAGGVGTLTYGLFDAAGTTPATLPAGLSFSTTTGQISGTPTAQLAVTTYTVKVTDQSTPTAQTSAKTFSLTVQPPALTTTQAVPSMTLTANSATGTPFTPVTASGGFGTITYAVSPALPVGLTFNTATGAISGTPTALLSTTTFTVTATDSATPTAQTSAKTFSLTVQPPALTTTQAVPSTTLTANSATGTPFTPVTAAGGFGTITYAVSPSLPAGLTFDTATGVISGTPTALLSATTFTVTATDSATPTAQTSAKTFSLTVLPPALTTTQAVPSTTLTANSATGTPFAPVTAAGGFGTVTFALSGGTLPAGLTFDTSTGAITGTPTALLSATTFTVTATDSTTPTAQTSAKTFSLTVQPPALTTTQAVPSTTLTANSAAGIPFTPVTAAGGFGTITYAVSPALPAGLSFNTATGEITGTPTTSLANTTFTVTATDSATPTAQTSSKTFSLTVNKAVATVALAASTTSVLVGQPVTFTATVSPSSATGTVTFLDGATALCSNVPVVAGVATCTVPLGSGGTHSVTAAYSGNAVLTPATSTAVTVSVTDQRPKTAEAIARFMSARNNQILSNGFDEGRQIDRLEEAASAQGGDGAAGSSFASGGAQGVARLGGGASRLGDSPDGGDLARLRFGARVPQAAPVLPGTVFGATPGTDSAFPYPLPEPSNPRWTEAAGSRSFSLGGPMRLMATTEGPANLAFSTSLRQVSRYADEQRAKDGGALGLAGQTFAPAARFNPFDIWVEGKYTSFRDKGDVDGRFGIVTLGMDYVFNPSLLLGVSAQYDSMKQTSAKQQTSVEGNGWMVGPYGTVRLTDHVFWQARAAWGRSSNDVSPFLTYTDSFESTRWLASTTLTGNWRSGPWLFRPSATIAYMEDTAQSYADTFGVIIPQVTTRLGQAKAGPVISYTLPVSSNLVIEPRLGAQLIWNFAGDAKADGLGTLSGDAAGPQGVRGRAEVGLKAQTREGVTVDLSGSYDGIGSGSYGALTGRAAIRVPLN